MGGILTKRELIMAQLAIEYMKENMEYFDTSVEGYTWDDFNKLSEKIDEIRQS